MALSFFDMAVSITPPSGHFEPQPLLMGANWQPNDIRVLMVSAYGASGSSGSHFALPMDPPLPDGFTAAYDLSSGMETKGVFWRRLQEGDEDTSVAWAKPPSWGNFLFVTLTVRGADPTAAPTAGVFPIAHQSGDTTATAASVTVPNAGVMVFCVATIPDPGSSSWPNWATAMGVPDDWTHLVATEKSGANFDQYNADSNVLVVGKKYEAAGSTGSVDIPIAVGRPAFISMYLFVQPAQDVTINVGAA